MALYTPLGFCVFFVFFFFAYSLNTDLSGIEQREIIKIRAGHHSSAIAQMAPTT